MRNRAVSAGTGRTADRAWVGMDGSMDGVAAGGSGAAGPDGADGGSPRRDGASGLWVLARSVAGVVLVLTAYYTLPVELHKDADVVKAIGFGVCVLGLAGLILYLISAHPVGGVPARAEGLLYAAMVSVVFFATVYVRLADQPAQFEGLVTRTDGLYFTLVTAATVGYGDVHPVGQGARVAVMVNIAFNLVFLGAAASVAMDRIKQRRRTHP